ncbi:hypothetical protein F5X68DRAFT_235652 [Plectosphaerella plurivora]|uniref:Uncharacterized protein n=1 Tax=Plectosphaerella plurivora TaxID=936078 RepID=A0A9P8V4H5_9PEZI|nr:hypothetical protein F5X68DRAFT_235652 [Plectosphaerella plurivora]
MSDSRPETLYEAFNKPNIPFPELPGPWRQLMARLPSLWIDRMVEVPMLAKVRGLPMELMREFAQRRLRPWEFLNQFCSRIGQFGREASRTDTKTGYASVDETTRSDNETAVVHHYNPHVGQPVSKEVHNLAKLAKTQAGTASQGSTPTESVFPPTLFENIRTRPETGMKMNFEGIAELNHWVNVVKQINMAAEQHAVAVAITRSGDSETATPKPPVVADPSEWKGRADNEMGYIKLSSTSLSPLDSNRKRKARDVPEDALDGYIPAIEVEHKGKGRLDLALFQEAYGSEANKIRTDPRRHLRDRTGDVFYEDLGSDYGEEDNTHTPVKPAVSRVVGQIGAYCLINNTRYGIIFDSHVLVLVIFNQLHDKHDWKGKFRLPLGEDMSLGIFDLTKSPRDVVLTSVLGFVMLGLVETLQRNGEDCSLERLQRLANAYLDENPHLKDVLVNQVVEEAQKAAEVVTETATIKDK